ncbi:MAG: CIA30 family protein [Bacteroidetes bacterium MedPE-SWsnd-G2]|nr:MAG: CIA30 family protein [Bacteroidetes bacterium MedPE-SWsnd-G2]
MTYFIFMLILFQGINSKIIFDFNKGSNITNWRIVDDVVMGGKSSSNFRLNSNGNGEFSGHVSIANNGGFSSVQYKFPKTEVTNYRKIKIRVKGDGKKYQLRVKNKTSNYYYYITTFSTTTEWQVIEIELKDMYPSFRGRRLNSQNFAHNAIEQIVFLIGNKADENFKLLIDKIELI